MGDCAASQIISVSPLSPLPSTALISRKTINDYTAITICGVAFHKYAKLLCLHFIPSDFKARLTQSPKVDKLYRIKSTSSTHLTLRAFQTSNIHQQHALFNIEGRGSPYVLSTKKKLVRRNTSVSRSTQVTEICPSIEIHQDID